jgi:hypothetical protein
MVTRSYEHIVVVFMLFGQVMSDLQAQFEAKIDALNKEVDLQRVEILRKEDELKKVTILRLVLRC